MEIRFAKKSDKPRIIDFIKNNWTGSSILTESDLIFDYQYMTFTECGFVIAELDGEIIGIKGYIPLNSTDSPDIAAALAIVTKNSHPMLNMELQMYLEKNTNSRMSCSAGLNPNTAARIYPLFRYKVDKFEQYYMHSDINNFKIAVINKPSNLNCGSGKSLIEITDLEMLESYFDAESYRENMPYKDYSYINYRYFNHPVYKYHIYATLKDSSSVSSLIVGREVSAEGSKAFRIVDYIGSRDDIKYLGVELKKLMLKNSYEYIDFYCYGMPQDAMTECGFTKRDSDDENIIPNYFEPFVQKNVDITFFCKQHKDFLICKADGDQDRPSILPKIE